MKPLVYPGMLQRLPLGVAEAYTDGSCYPNPGPGGFAWIVVHDGQIIAGQLVSTRGRDTTNNRMELGACIAVCEWDGLADGCKLTINSDSEYVVKCMQAQRKRRRKNVDLWERLYTASSRHKVTWRHVRGHNGQRWNELADELAGHAGARSRNQAVGELI